MKQALEALGICESMLPEYHQWLSNAQYDLRTAITEAERQEPVAWLHSVRQDSDVITTAVKHLWGRVPVAVGKEAAYTIPLYTHPQPAIPAGWQLVPVEPTSEILESVWGRKLDKFDHGARRIAAEKYKAMLAAAPKQEEMK